MSKFHTSVYFTFLCFLTLTNAMQVNFTRLLFHRLLLTFLLIFLYFHTCLFDFFNFLILTNAMQESFTYLLFRLLLLTFLLIFLLYNYSDASKFHMSTFSPTFTNFLIYFLTLTNVIQVSLNISTFSPTFYFVLSFTGNFSNTSSFHIYTFQLSRLVSYFHLLQHE